MFVQWGSGMWHCTGQGDLILLSTFSCHPSGSPVRLKSALPRDSERLRHLPEVMQLVADRALKSSGPDSTLGKGTAGTEGDGKVRAWGEDRRNQAGNDHGLAQAGGS